LAKRDLLLVLFLVAGLVMAFAESAFADFTIGAGEVFTLSASSIFVPIPIHTVCQYSDTLQQWRHSI